MFAVLSSLFRHIGSRSLRGAWAALAIVVATSVLSVASVARAASTVTLLDSGVGEKRVLLFQPRVGATQTVDFEVSVRMKMSGLMPMDVEIPGMHLGMKSTIVKVNENGDFTYTVEVVDASVDEAAEPAMREQMQSQVVGLIGTRGTIVADAHGNTLSSEFAAPSGAPPELVENLKKSMAGTSANLPEQAVGTGARWQVKQSLSEGGTEVQQTATYVLSKLTDDGVTIDVQIEQTAQTGPLADPNLPPGATAELAKFQGVGKGSSSFRFDQPMVVSSDLSMNVDTTVKMAMQGQEQTMEMSMGMTTVVRPR